MAITISGSFTVTDVVLTVIVSPVTVKSPDTVTSLAKVTTSSESPIVTVLEGKPSPKTVFKFAGETETSVFVIAPEAAPKYPHCVADIVVEPMFSICAPSDSVMFEISVT